ncbi:MAG: hypothetical protein WC314_24665 [Vulcanimicrobiota bacterium]
MSQQKTILAQAEQLSEEGRLLLVLGRALKQAVSGAKEPLGSWALKELTALRGAAEAPETAISPPKQSPRKGARARNSQSQIVVVWIASESYCGQWRSVAVGTDAGGYKRLLSFQDGATVNPTICEAIVEELSALDLPGDGSVLFVTDGSVILEDVMRLHWDRLPFIAHCQSVVAKAVKAHLQGEKQEQIAERLKGVWQLGGPQANSALRTLVSELDKECPGAAERLARSLEATLVVDSLGVKSPLKKHIVTAGCARMALMKAREYGGHDLSERKAQVAAWVEKTRRVPGCQELPQLAVKLFRLATKNLERKEAASPSLESKDAAHH